MIGSRAWIPISLQISRRSTRLSCIAVFPSSGAIFDLDGIQQRVAELDERMSAPDFWDDQNAARALMAEVNPLKHRMEAFSALKSRLEDIDAAIELAQEADDDDLGREAVEEFAKNARSRGIKVIIAAAGMAAHLPGVIAASTPLPVIGVPIKSSLDGMDALLAIVQMPPGIPVATVGINGALNAAILAVQMLSLEDKELETKFIAYKEGLKKKIVKANEELKEVKFEYKTN